MNRSDFELKKLLSTETYELSDDNFSQLLSFAEEVSYAKGAQIIKAGTIDDNLYIVKEGIIRGSHSAGKKESTLYFAIRGDMIISVFSYHKGLPAAVSVEACCDSTLLRVPKKNVQEFARTSLDFANWMLEMAIDELYLIVRKRVVLSGDAYERYESFFRIRGEIIRHVPLKHIASYLGITQPSLSRLRSPRYKDTL